MALLALWIRRALNDKSALTINDFIGGDSKTAAGDRFNEYESMTEEEKKMRGQEISNWFDKMEEKEKEGKVKIIPVGTEGALI